jgi:hypothetical protein
MIEIEDAEEDTDDHKPRVYIGFSINVQPSRAKGAFRNGDDDYSHKPFADVDADYTLRADRHRRCRWGRDSRL